MQLSGPGANRPRKNADGKPYLTFVTGNAKKLEEVKAILSAQAAATAVDGVLPYEVINMKIDLPELQGNPIEVSREKCRLAALEVCRSLCCAFNAWSQRSVCNGTAMRQMLQD